MTPASGALALKPQPRVTALTQPFWDGANEGRLMIQRCTRAGCAQAVFYPRVCCPVCHGDTLEWIQASGRGRIVTHTTVHRPHHDGFHAQAPYVFAAVALQEGPCIYAEVPGAPLEESLLGRAVVVDFVDHGPGRRMPVFRLA